MMKQSLSNTDLMKTRLTTWLSSRPLTPSTLGKIFSRLQFEIFFLCFLENRNWLFMQIVSNGDNLHEESDPVF